MFQVVPSWALAVALYYVFDGAGIGTSTLPSCRYDCPPQTLLSPPLFLVRRTLWAWCGRTVAGVHSGARRGAWRRDLLGVRGTCQWSGTVQACQVHRTGRSTQGQTILGVGRGQCAGTP